MSINHKILIMLELQKLGMIQHRLGCCLFLLILSCGCIAEAGQAYLETREFALSTEQLSDIKNAHSKALEDARRQRRSINLGPARLFLEGNGIEFPYGATATLSGGGLVIKNTEANLSRIRDLLDAVSATSAEVVEPAELKEPEIPLFDPETMHFRRVTHKDVVYTNVTVIGSNPIELEIVHATGGAVLPLRELHPSIQRRYGFDTEKAYAFEQARRPARQVVSINPLPKLREVVPREVPAQPSSSLTEASASEPRENPQEAKITDDGLKKVDPVVGAAEVNAVDETDSSASVEAINIVDEHEGVHEVEVADGSDKTEQKAGGRSGESIPRVYSRIHSRDGRVFENVAVRVDHMGFTIRKQEETGKTEERVSFWDAPSSLLLDFEKFEELFSRMLVARDRTQLYELNRDGIAGGKPFHELAKDPPVGRGFVSVPEGYVFANMNWMSLPQPAVELVRGIGTRSFALGDAGKLVGLSGSEWWNRYAGHKTPRLSVPSRWAKKEPSKLGVLYSIFNPEVPILGNTAGEILNLWVGGKADQNGLLALVETGNGLFLGYYQEHAALGGAELTWEDAVSDKTKRFQLRRVSSQKIGQGERLLKLFDASARRILGAEFKEVGQLKLSARHYHAILERGVEAAVQDRVLPKGDGVQFPESGVATTTSPSFEKVVITDQIVAKLKDVLPQAYVFDVESQQRVIEIRKREVGGRISLQESNPKRQRQNEVVEVSPDLDGGLRFTDGKVVYELKPVFGGTEFVVWEAERNKLRRH